MRTIFTLHWILLSVLYIYSILIVVIKFKVNISISLLDIKILRQRRAKSLALWIVDARIGSKNQIHDFGHSTVLPLKVMLLSWAPNLYIQVFTRNLFSRVYQMSAKMSMSICSPSPLQKKVIKFCTSVVIN